MLAAALAIFGFVDVPIVYMTIRWFRTQHPSPVIGGGEDSGLDPGMWPPSCGTGWRSRCSPLSGGRALSPAEDGRGREKPHTPPRLQGGAA